MPESRKIRKYVSVAGLFLVVCPMGIMWYWANLSVYLNSYIVNKSNASSNVQSTWFVACFEAGSCAGFLVSGFLIRAISKRWTAVVGALTFLFGLVFSYVIIDVSGLVVKVVAGTTTAFGLYIANGAILEYLLVLEDEDYGFLVAATQCGLTAGPIVMNQLITLWINPGNLSPDLKIGAYVFFSQPAILDEVPVTLLKIAACTAICFIIGLSVVELNINSFVAKATLSNGTQISYGTADEEAVGVEKISGRGPPSGLTPLQAIQTREMCVFCVLNIFGALTYGVNCNFYKSYGQLFIQDDHFLTNATLLILIGATVSRPGWGWLSDRFTIKSVFMMYFSLSGISSLCFYFSPFINRWVYVVMSVVFISIGGAIYLIMIVACTKTFGDKYSVYNSGILLVPSSVFISFSPMLFQYLLDNFGWFYLYASCATWNLIALLGCAVTLSNKHIALF